MEITVNSAKATRREWLGLAVIALPCALYSMDLTVLDLAVPAISADLRPSSAQLLWILDVYGFVLAGSLIPMGTLGDRIGRRRILLMGAAAFCVMSILAAFSGSAGMLIATRAGLGLAGATVAPSTLSLIRNMFRDPSQRTIALGFWISSYSVGTAIGPLVGGAMLEHFWWGSVFLVGLPLMLLLLLLGPRLLPEFRAPTTQPIDLLSTLLSLAAVLLIIYGLKRIAQDGFAPTFAASLLAGVAASALFVRRQGRLSHPLMDLGLLRAPAFRVSLAAYALASFIALGEFVFLAQYLQMVLGLTPLHAGLWTAPFALAFIVGSQLTPLVARRVAPPSIIATGLAVASLGFGVLSQIHADAGLALLVSGMVVFALGLAPVFTLANDLMLSSAPPERAGAAAAISETSSELGGALGIAVLGSIGTAVYRGAMTRDALQAVPTDSLESARDTLGAALAIADKLPPQLGSDLAYVAREAFASSLRLTSALASVVALALAIVAVFWIKPTPDRQADVLLPKGGLDGPSNRAPSSAVSGASPVGSGDCGRG
jgi:DHA2 family multidrug resistance protein-like MFS transporter